MPADGVSRQDAIAATMQHRHTHQRQSQFVLASRETSIQQDVAQLGNVKKRGNVTDILKEKPEERRRDSESTHLKDETESPTQ
ncbi:hypothetical protein FHS27_001188 [Rhodopirellula rubra]|uniref:Uncharacterized protein n=1 Tax=Aporhodopirellula rubra TaxID=980271 RepID=A0A7W5H4P5_9BACT|nr:hypothetical protein [Aporhodopirellula rubra]